MGGSGVAGGCGATQLGDQVWGGGGGGGGGSGEVRGEGSSRDLLLLG